MKRSIRRRWLAAVLPITLLAACGGSDSSDSSTTTAASPTSSASVAPPTSGDAASDTSATSASATTEASGSQTATTSAGSTGSTGGGTVKAGDSVQIGFSVQSISRTFFSGMEKGIQDAIPDMEKKYGVTISVNTMTAQDEASIQDENVSDMIAQGVNGVIFSPVNSGAAPPMVDRLLEANIPVVAVANQIGSVDEYGQNTVYPGTAAYVTNDDVSMGAKAADAANALAEKVDGTAQIFILQGTNGAANVPLRQKGFEDQLDTLGTDWNLVDARPGDFSNTVAEQTCQDAITSTPDIDIIFSMSDEMTSGCVRALESADRLDIGIASIGGNEKGIALIKDGLLPATVCQKPGTMGATALDALLNNLVNGTDEGLKFYDTPVVTKDNLDVCVPQW